MCSNCERDTTIIMRERYLTKGLGLFLSCTIFAPNSLPSYSVALWDKFEVIYGVSVIRKSEAFTIFETIAKEIENMKQDIQNVRQQMRDKL